MQTKEYRINSLLTLKLEENETVIYVNEKRFRQCKYLLLINPNEKEKNIDSIDLLAEFANKSLEVEIKPIDLGITPEQEFMAHCSNLQAWYENDYDTRLIHSNLAFPLLKRLTETGDSLAQKVFKKEIIERIVNAEKNIFLNTLNFLVLNGYMEFLEKSDLAMISPILKSVLLKLLNKDGTEAFHKFDYLISLVINKLSEGDFYDLMGKISSPYIKDKLYLIHNVKFKKL